MAVAEKLAEAVGGQRGAAGADRLCEACVDLLDVDAAAISLIYDGANNGTLGASGAPARVYDEVQFTLGEGPCLDAVARRVPVLAHDLADVAAARWPAYTPAMLAHQIRSVYAMPVVVAGQYLGALDLFRAEPRTLESEQLGGALIAATLAGLRMLDLLDTELQAAVNDPDSDAWAELTALSRAEVSQATGMLMAQLDIGAAEALVRLRAHAYATDRSATDVARDILERRLRLKGD